MNRIKKFLEPVDIPLTTQQRQEVIRQLASASTPTFDFFVMIVLSTSIATFGLIADSPAVVIGAMLVAPLMSPILGLSLASVIGRQNLYRRAVWAVIQGAALSVLLAWLLSLFALALPFDSFSQLPGEIVARTRPSPFDLIIAIAGGAAAAYALAQPKLSAALPGVAIATALVPPLCTVGIGLALRDPNIALGALLLFVTNLVAISFAGIIIFAALGFRSLHPEPNADSSHHSLLISTVLVLLVLVPLVFFTLRLVEQARTERAAAEFRREVETA